MSFSQDIKEEILYNTKFNKCCKVVEKCAESLTEDSLAEISLNTKRNISKNNCCKKAFLRGLFLGSGCIVDPNTDYHFEVTCKGKKNADAAVKILNEIIGFNFKTIKRGKNQYVIYSKDSEEISLVLSFLGAGKALLKFENLRIERSIKNDINRNINCETANLGKTISAAYTQIQAIEKLEKTGVLKDLPSEIKELCKLRKSNPEMSLSEITKAYGTSITKSGINHRFKKIIELSKNVKE